MKRCSTLIDSREMQINTTMSYYQPRLKFNKSAILSVVENVEDQNSQLLLVGV